MPKVRPRHISTRPVDEPAFISPTGMDFERRRMIFPPGFIDEIVLKGGDEYVKADDLKTLISAIVDYLEPVLKMGPILKNIETHLALGSDEELDEEGEN